MKVNNTNNLNGDILEKSNAVTCKKVTAKIKEQSIFKKDTFNTLEKELVSNNPFDDVKKSIRKGNFKWIDSDKDQKVTLSEYLSGGDPNDTTNQKSVQDFKEADINNDFVIELEEAMNSKAFGIIDNEEDFKPVLDLFFEYIDINQDETISKEEFLEYNNISDEKQKELFYTIFRLSDTNNDSKLSKEEFKKYIYSKISTGLDMDISLHI